MALPTIRLNSKDIAYWQLTPLEGTLSAIMKPPPYKKLVSNDNASINGKLFLASPTMRKIDTQDVSLSFFIRALSIENLQQQLKRLEKDLINGDEGTGINMLYIPEFYLCVRLIYVGMSKFEPFYPHGSAIITLKFTEPDPSNRTLN